ncbi:MAG: Uma2 family endonuclease [Isosphaeraceae bacterium]
MMATSAGPQPLMESSEQRVVFQDVGWGDYESMLRIVGERRIRVTYDEGTMEVRMPPQRHEQAAQLLGLFVPRLAEELEVPYEPLGMTTWRKPDAEKGLEPDQCYYIQNQAVVRTRDVLNLEVDPPPDLAIEVDITRSSLNRMGIYAELGVPEVWRYDGRTLTMSRLQGGQYQPSDESQSFPGLQPLDVERFIDLGRTMDKLRWTRQLRDWVRDELIPRRRQAGPIA